MWGLGRPASKPPTKQPRTRVERAPGEASTAATCRVRQAARSTATPARLDLTAMALRIFRSQGADGAITPELPEERSLGSY